MDGNHARSSREIYLGAWRAWEAEALPSERPISPYVGLRHFDLDTAGLLFGRQGSAEAVLSKFEREPTVFVIGGSGCGKSSIVRGSVMETLRLVARPVQNRHGPWIPVEMRPGVKPVDALVDAAWCGVFAPLYRAVPDGPEVEVASATTAQAHAELDRAFGVDQHELRRRIEAALRADPVRGADDAEIHRGVEVVRGWIDRLDHGIDAADDDIAAPPDDPAVVPPRPIADRRVGSINLMLLIDQFEEIFRPEVEPGQRRALVAMMRHIFLNRPEGVLLAVTMRAEDLHRCAEEPDLPEMVNRSTHLVGWLSREELRDAIIKPARAVFAAWGLDLDRDNPGAPYEPSVVERLVEHVSELHRELDHKSDHLPLLQHALTRLWQVCCTRWGREMGMVRDDAAPVTALRVTEADLDYVIADAGGDEAHWMSRALEATVEKALLRAYDAFDSRLAQSSPAGGADHEHDPRAIAIACLRAAMSAMASKEEQGRYHRRFVRPEVVARERLTTLFRPADAPRVADALAGALDELADPRWGLLTRSEDAQGAIYDVTHEALIRNSPTLGRWLEHDAEIVAALARVVSRSRRILRDGSNEHAVLAEDKPHLTHVFDPPPPAAATRSPVAGKVNPAAIRREARRLYRLTHSTLQLGKAASQQLDVGSGVDPEALMKEAGALYRERCKHDDAEVARRENEQVAMKLKNRSIRALAGVGLVLACLVGLYFAISNREGQIKRLREVYAMAPAPSNSSQPIGAKLGELRAAAMRYLDEIHGDEKPHNQFMGLFGLGDVSIPDARFLALTGLDTQLREIFGQTYQLYPGDSTVGDAGAPFCHNATVASPTSTARDGWMIGVNRLREGVGEIQITKLADGSKLDGDATVALINPALSTHLEVPLTEYPVQICLGLDGRVLTVMRPAPDGSAIGPIPDILYLHHLQVKPAQNESGMRSLIVDITPLRGGGPYHASAGASSDDVEPDIRDRSAGSSSVKVEVIGIRSHAAGLFVIVAFRHSEKPFEAWFAPTLSRPVPLDASPDRAGRPVQALGGDQVAILEFNAALLSKALGIPALSIEVAMTPCFGPYSVTISLLRRDVALEYYPPKSLSCNGVPSDGTELVKPRLGHRIMEFPSEPITDVKLSEDHRTILLRTMSGTVLSVQIAFPVEQYIATINDFGSLVAYYDKPDLRFASPYCRSAECGLVGAGHKP